MLLPGRRRHLSGGLAAWVAAVLLGHGLLLSWVRELGLAMRQPEGESEREQQGVEGGGRHGDYCFSSSSSLRRRPGP